MKYSRLLLISLAMLVSLSSCSSSDIKFVRVMAMDEILDMENTFQQWKLKHGKTYDTREEEAMRRNIFYQNLQAIQEHNAKYPEHVSYTKGLNQFSDLTLEEYRVYNKLRPMTNLTRGGSTFIPPSFVTLPDSVDWRTKGLVTGVKDQKQCGSCWAFSATGSVEGQHAKANGTLLSLSEQQLVDCSRSFGNEGCDGGLMVKAFLYIKSQPGGLETEADYPYTAKDGRCKADPSKEVAKVTGYVNVKPYSEADLQKAVATVGPVSVAIDANHDSFMAYKAGIYKEPRCSSTRLDHGVLVVGYGTQNGQDYWIVKNSWGTNWGQSGFILMARNNKNMCGIASMASFPLV